MLAERLLAPVCDAGVDTLLLGCTHYPYLARTISDVMGRDVVLVSSADETAFEVRAVLDATDLARGTECPPGTHRFLSSGDVAVVRGDRSAAARPRARATRRRCHGVDVMALSVTVLGCSGTYAGPGGACSGYLVRGGPTSVWVDTGPGTLGNLQQHIDITALDAVVVSHSHPDHWGELGVFRNALKYGFQVEGMPVYSTSAVRELRRHRVR